MVRCGQGWEVSSVQCHVWLSQYICMYIIYIYICMFEFMIKKDVFLDLPFQDSHLLAACSDLLVCSVTSGMFTARSVCWSAVKFFCVFFFFFLLLFFFSQLIYTTNSAYLFHIPSEYMY